MALRLRSTSSAVVAQELTLIRIAVRPFHSVMPHQQVHSASISSMKQRVRLASPKRTITWFATMSRNAGSVADFFKLPHNCVVELGTRVQI
jgi:K+ transporter